MRQRKKLTDYYLQSLKPAADGKPYEVMDETVRQMGVRVMGTAAHPVLTFILVTRFAAGASPTRRALGAYLDPDNAPARDEATVDDLLLRKALTLAEARRKAQAWLDMVARGIDPVDDLERRRKEVERQRQAEAERQENTFAKVFEAFAAEKLVNERTGGEVKRDITKEFLPSWTERPVTDITERDVLKIIKAKKATAPAQARNLLGQISRLFQWAINQRVYEITVNPCASLKPKETVGKKKRRQRVLEDDELWALWRASKRMPYPVGPVYQLLALTALRLNEVADASWPEFSPAVVRALRQRKEGERIDWSKVSNEPLTWIIPAERMKGENDEARPHLVPLTPDILQILESLPLFKKGDYLFSTTFGAKPVWIGNKIKKAIDARMLRTLRARARHLGDDPTRTKLESWVNHDIRRTVRSNLSRLRITEEAREAVLAHARPGIKGHYDHHQYAAEKREALELWAARLRSIVELPPRVGNVVQLQHSA